MVPQSQPVAVTPAASIHAFLDSNSQVIETEFHPGTFVDPTLLKEVTERSQRGQNNKTVGIIVGCNI